MLESYLISVAIKSTVLLLAGMLCLRLPGPAGCGCAAFGLSDGARQRGCHSVAGALVSAMERSSFLSRWARALDPAGARWEARLANWRMALAAIWALGTFAMAIRAAGGWVMLSGVRRRSEYFTDTDGAGGSNCGCEHSTDLWRTASGDSSSREVRAIGMTCDCAPCCCTNRRTCAARLHGEVCCARVASNLVVESAGMDASRRD